MQKSERQKYIIDLITARRIERQEDLANALKKNGFGVTQASVSRDLEELGIVKVNGIYAKPASGALGIAPSPIDLDTAGDNLIVVRCPSGLASAFAVKIDAERYPEVVGTIAGDDTIFLAVKGHDAQSRVIHSLSSLFEIR